MHHFPKVQRAKIDFLSAHAHEASKTYFDQNFLCENVGRSTLAMLPFVFSNARFKFQMTFKAYIRPLFQFCIFGGIFSQKSFLNNLRRQLVAVLSFTAVVSSHIKMKTHLRTVRESLIFWLRMDFQTLHFETSEWFFLEALEVF